MRRLLLAYSEYRNEPYRLFFPLGILFLILGLVPWILWRFHFLQTYPRDLHTTAMIGGFLLQFTTGFLMTAVPKFTGARPSSLLETSLAFGISLIGLFSLSLTRFLWADLCSLALLIFLAIFAGIRFKNRRWNLPPSFLFLPAGFVFGILGCSFLILRAWNPVLNTSGRLLFYEGMMLSFILGVGARLISALLGWAPNPKVLIQASSKSRNWKEIDVFTFLVILFALAYASQIFGLWRSGQILKILVVLYIAVTKWKLYKLPNEPGALSWGIYFSAWFAVLGVCLPVFPEFSSTHWAHVLYLGGFASLSLFIAARVTLAHGGYDLLIEQRSPVLRIVSILTMGSLGLRVWAGLDSEMFSNALISAALIFLVSILVWAIYFVPKMKIQVVKGGYK